MNIRFNHLLLLPMEDGDLRVKYFANATARDTAIPNPVNGQVVANAQTGLEVYLGYWHAVGASVDRLAPDWWWSARSGLADIADGADIDTWTSREPGAAVAVTPLFAGAKPTLDLDGMFGSRAVAFTADILNGTLGSAHSVNRLTVATMFAWDGSDAGDIFAHADVGTGQRAWYMSVAATGILSVKLSANGSALAKIYNSAAGVVDTNPACYAFTFNAGTLNVFKNGTALTMTKATDNACAALHDSTADVTMCGSLSSGASAEPTSGTASDFLIFNRVLSENELAQLTSALRAS